jgi:high-affinity K+ transport system ATPase subunit B
MVVSSGIIVNTAVNGMAYAVKQYADAEPLLCIDNKKLVGVIHIHDILKAGVS